MEEEDENRGAVRDTRTTLARNEAIALREMQMEDLVFLLRLGIKRSDQVKK